MRLQEYQCVGMVSLFPIFFSRVGALSFIFWNDHHQWQTIAEDFQTPYSFMISSSYFFDKQVPCTERFLKNFEKVPGNIAKSSWEPKFIYLASNS